MVEAIIYCIIGFIALGMVVFFVTYLTDKKMRQELNATIKETTQVAVFSFSALCLLSFTTYYLGRFLFNGLLHFLDVKFPL